MPPAATCRLLGDLVRAFVSEHLRRMSWVLAIVSAALVDRDLMETPAVAIVPAVDQEGEIEARPGKVTSLLPGHDRWVVDDEPVALIDWQGASVRTLG